MTTYQNPGYVPVGDLRPAPWTRTFASAINIANGIKTSIATANTQQTYSGGQLNGSIGQNPFTLPQLVTVTSAVHAASYVLQAITINGFDENGNAISDTVTPTLVNGGETLVSTKAFVQVSSIVFPAQNDALGSWTVGVQDVVMGGGFARELRGAAGNVTIKYQDGSSDTLACLAGEHHKVMFNRIVGSTTTAFPLVIYG